MARMGVIRSAENGLQWLKLKGRLIWAQKEAHQEF